MFFRTCAKDYKSIIYHSHNDLNQKHAHIVPAVFAAESKIGYSKYNKRSGNDYRRHGNHGERSNVGALESGFPFRNFKEQERKRTYRYGQNCFYTC